MPLVIGLVTLLMVSSIAINELIIRGLQSATRIEAANRAYMAAEGGIEDALYELTPHFAGYKTPALNNEFVRNSDFGGDLEWINNWAIESHSGDAIWPDPPGRFYENQKLMIYLFNDTNLDTSGTANAINNGPFESNDIEAVDANIFAITFTIPNADVVITGSSVLKIDNDGDYDGTDNTINEDPDEPITQEDLENCPENPEDNDCDGKVNEDNEDDPVILWSLTDGAEKSLMPKKGCAGVGSEICEKGFSAANSYGVTLDQTATGINENGAEETIDLFINRAIYAPDGSLDAKLHFEFLIIAPLEHVDTPDSKINEIPYIEYVVDSSSDQLPYPFFRIKSDGYYGTYKQSITSTVTPKTTVPLFDFTIIQQQ